MSSEEILAQTRQWVEDFIIGLNMCPFAKAPALRQGIRYIQSRVSQEEERFAELLHECALLADKDGPETTLYVISEGLQHFETFLVFCDLAEAVIDATEHGAYVQLVSFHPHYCFEGADITDAANATNQSPYPMIHLLKRADVAAAIDAHPDIQQIPIDNIKRLREGH